MSDLPRVTLDLKPGQKIAICRCGQSQNLPYCDGSHKEYNASRSYNLNPIIIQCYDDKL